jgi:hypothetical protein
MDNELFIADLPFFEDEESARQDAMKFVEKYYPGQDTIVIGVNTPIIASTPRLARMDIAFQLINVLMTAGFEDVEIQHNPNTIVFKRVSEEINQS